MIDFKNISNIQELTAAQAQVKNHLKQKEFEIKNLYRYNIDFYSPNNIIYNGINAFSESLTLDKILLTGVRYLKKILTK